MVNGVGLGISHGAVGGSVTLSFNDNVKLSFGDDADGVIVLDSAGLAADAELAGVIEGTSDHQGSAANSVILSNITDDGDMMFLVSDGGNSLEFLLADADVARVTLGWGMTSLEFALGGAKEMIYTTGLMAFQQAAEISTTAGGLKLNPFGAVLLEGNNLIDLSILRGRASANLKISANQTINNVNARRVVVTTLDTTGDADIDAAYAVPTATETTPFWAQRADITTPLIGTLDASFLTFKWVPADDSVTVFVNDGGVIRSVSIGTVT